MEVSSTEKERSSSSDSQPAIVRACDMCRKKKIRCQPTEDACLQCIKYKTHCHFTPISTKRKPRRPAGHKTVEQLESRLQRMEGLLKLAIERGSIGRDAILQDQNVVSGAMDVSSTENIDGIQEVCLSLSTPESLGLDSPVTSLPVPYQFRPISKTSDQSPVMIWEPVLNREHPNPSNAWKGSLVRDVFSRRVFNELPPKSHALVLIDEAFMSFNSTFPIFDQFRFMQYFQNHYSETGPNDAGWWACLNVVLALAHRFRAMRTLETQTENAQACGYMQNALSVVSELTMLHNSLPAIQALLGMTVVLEGTPNPRLCSVLNSAALRLAQTMGLHRKNQDPSLTHSEIEERKNVFWIAYFLDRDISLRTGQPPVQDDDDMDVDLPSGTISDLPHTALAGNSLDSINFFNARIGLAIIQGQIYKKLFSVKAAQQSEAQQLVAAQELDNMLVSWRRSVPIDFDDDFITTLQPPIATEILHMIILRFNYVNCLITVHRPFPPSTKPSLDPALVVQSPSLSSESNCIIEARKAVRLIQITPNGDYACAWLLIHYFFAAVTALLHNVLANPAYHQARSDLQLAGPFLQLLEILASEGKSEEVQKMFEYCEDLNGRAKEAVESVNRRMICANEHARKEKTQAEKESVEEFIRRVECISAGCPEAAARSFAAGQTLDAIENTWGGSSVVGNGGFGEFDGMLDG